MLHMGQVQYQKMSQHRIEAMLDQSGLGPASGPILTLTGTLESAASQVYCYSLVGLDQYRYRVSDIGRYSPVSVGIVISILIWVSVPIPVALLFVYLSQQSTLLQRTPIVSSLYRIFAQVPCIHNITCTHLYPTQNCIFSTKNLYGPVSVSV